MAAIVFRSDLFFLFSSYPSCLDGDLHDSGVSITLLTENGTRIEGYLWMEWEGLACEGFFLGRASL
jgi:hypothetical protein